MDPKLIERLITYFQLLAVWHHLCGQLPEMHSKGPRSHQLLLLENIIISVVGRNKINAYLC